MFYKFCPILFEVLTFFTLFNFRIKVPDFFFCHLVKRLGILTINRKTGTFDFNFSISPKKLLFDINAKNGGTFS